MKVTLNTLSGDKYRHIYIANGKVMVMTCNKGRRKGKTSAYVPSDPSKLDELFNREVKRANDDGFTQSTAVNDMVNTACTIFYAEITESKWNEAALQTFLAVGMVIPTDIRETPLEISCSPLKVRRTLSKYIVNGQMNSLVDESCTPTTGHEKHIKTIINVLAPLVALGEKVIFTTDDDNEGSIEHTEIEPVRYIKDNQSLISDCARLVLADAGIIRVPVSLSALNIQEQDISFCI